MITSTVTKKPAAIALLMGSEEEGLRRGQRRVVCLACRVERSLSDPDNIPFFGRMAEHHKIRDSILNTEAEDWTMNINVEAKITVTANFQRTPVALRFIELIDSRRTMSEIVETIQSENASAPPAEDVWKTCRHLIDLFLQFDFLLLRHKSVPPFLMD